MTMYSKGALSILHSRELQEEEEELQVLISIGSKTEPKDQRLEG